MVRGTKRFQICFANRPIIGVIALNASIQSKRLKK